MAEVFAFCDRRGVIEFGPDLADGCLEIGFGEEAKLRELMCATARHAHQPGVLLVPGVPEATSDEAALDALEAWLLWLKRR